MFVFDFYNVLSSKTGGGASDLGLATGNHHRVWNGAVQHKTDDGADRLAYPSAGGDSHPNAAGDQKATAEFVPLLNAAYNAWVGNGGSDATPPTATATGAANGTWYKSAVTVTLSAEDNPGGSGVAKTEYRLDAGSWMTGTSVTVTAPTGGANDGTHTVAYRSTDLAGNVEVGKTCTVNIDTPRPTTKAPSSATARRGRTAALKYQVLDTVPNGGTATVTIKVKNRAGKVVKTLKSVVKPVNTSLTWKFTVPRTWRTGTYRFYVSAHRDTAGNVGANVASNKLIVR